MQERLFVAIWPDAGARAALRSDVDRARGTHPELRWQPEGRWHVTLAFLGAVDTTSAGRRLEALARHPLPGAEPVRTRGSGAFGPVLWVGLEHGPWLGDLARTVQQALHVEDRRFRGHVTVARARGAEQLDQARAAVPSLAEHLGPHWLPAELTLVASRTGPEPSYHVRHAWPLAPSDGSARAGGPT
jgi:RNA 2',3'-cyclic 3'-phosphodiesterase